MVVECRSLPLLMPGATAFGKVLEKISGWFTVDNDGNISLKGKTRLFIVYDGWKNLLIFSGADLGPISCATCPASAFRPRSRS